MCWKFTRNWLRLIPGHEMRVSSVQYNSNVVYIIYVCICGAHNI